MSGSGVKKGSSTLVAVIGDRDTVTGFLLAGIGERNSKGERNFLIVEDDTKPDVIEEAFKRFTTSPNISVVLINQKIAEQHLRPLINTFDGIFPTILEIPSKDAPYDLKKDTIAIKAAKLLWGSDANLA